MPLLCAIFIGWPQILKLCSRRTKKCSYIEAVILALAAEAVTIAHVNPGNTHFCKISHKILCQQQQMLFFVVLMHYPIYKLLDAEKII